MTVTLEGADGTPVSGKTVALAAEPGTTATIDPASAVTDTDGQALFAVADTSPETVTFTATDTTDSLTLSQTASVQFETSASSATASTISLSTSTTPADGVTPAIVFVTIENQFGNHLPGQAVEPLLTDNSGDATVQSAGAEGASLGVTNSEGQVEFEVRDTAAETVTLGAQDTTAGITLASTVAITFVAGQVDSFTSIVDADPTTVPDDGQTASTITVEALDQLDNPVSGQVISLAATGGSSVITPVAPTTNAFGQATFTVTDMSAETVLYMAADTTDGVSIGETTSVTFTPTSPPPQTPEVSSPILLPASAALISGVGVVFGLRRRARTKV